MIDGDGYPPLTDEVKADILGRNYARLHGIDVDAAQAAIAGDELSRKRQSGSRRAMVTADDAGTT